MHGVMRKSGRVSVGGVLGKKCLKRPAYKKSVPLPGRFFKEQDV